MRHLSLSVCALALLASACSVPNDDPADVNGAGGSTAMSGGKGGGGTGPSGGASSSSGGSAGTPNGGASSGSGGSSGGAGDGGSGGSGGTTPHVVAPCGETGETGVWENVTPPELAGIDTPGGALVVDPVNPATLYVGTGHQGIYK
ncbi:MAG TPA: hypothetical protein VGP93_14940, partial [Polyangiaceae bacterium]|nr:hypothetical protein [Polyangiaceae bacterium]